RESTALTSVVNSITPPVLLLSGGLLPLSLAPGWLSGIASVNPFLYVVEAAREAFLGEYGTGTLWLGAAVAAGFAALGLIAGTRAFQRQINCPRPAASTGALRRSSSSWSEAAGTPPMVTGSRS